MAGTFNHAMSETSDDFNAHVWPVLSHMLKGEIVPVEGRDNPALRMLDMYCGIDYLLKLEGSNVIWGVASRIQRIGQNCKPWNTFTVRLERDSGAKTEFNKRVRDILLDGIYPRITYHAYVKGGQLATLGVCLTKELVEFCANGNPETRHTNEWQCGQAEFYVCHWKDMVVHGCNMSVYLAETQTIYRYEHGELIRTKELRGCAMAGIQTRMDV